MKKNCILINSYPNDTVKLQLLREQISHFKSLELPIILCSGCSVPQDIIHNVHYIIINKEKIIKPAVYQKKKYLEGRNYVSAFYDQNVVMFNDNLDLTITKNIKLLFKLAKFFDFENVMYTEDDNIFIDSDQYQNEHLEILNKESYKICANLSKMENLDMFHTTHFFANVNFFLENFIFPHSVNGLDDPYILSNLRPWSAYESSIHECFRNKLDKVYNIDPKYTTKFIDHNKQFGRDNDVNYLINQRVTLLKRKDKTVCGYVLNTSSLINNLKIKVYTKDSYYESESFNSKCWYVTPDLSLGDYMKVEMTNKDGNLYKKEIIFDSEDKILALETN